MALAPKFAGQSVLAGSPHGAVHTLELYLDYVCPFSSKMFATLYGSVFPFVAARYPSKVRFIFRQQIQPWHPSSTLCHEAGAAVLRLAPGKFYDFSAKLFELQKEFFDVNVVQEARNETYVRLAKVAGHVGIAESEILDLLRISDKPGEDGSLNTGNQVTNDVKLMVKANRLTGVHVTPTVVFNVRVLIFGRNDADRVKGIVENSISSSFTPEQWEEWLLKNIV